MNLSTAQLKPLDLHALALAVLDELQLRGTIESAGQPSLSLPPPPPPGQQKQGQLRLAVTGNAGAADAEAMDALHAALAHACEVPAGHSGRQRCRVACEVRLV